MASVRKRRPDRFNLNILGAEGVIAVKVRGELGRPTYCGECRRRYGLASETGGLESLTPS